MRGVRDGVINTLGIVDRYVIGLIKVDLAKEKERAWRDGFEAMGRGADMDVESMLPPPARK